MAADPLEGAQWRCTTSAPGALQVPADLDRPELVWWDASVPGTAAGALADAGDPGAATCDYDAEDWWFRCRFTAAAAGWRLELGGIATVADVWFNGELVVHSENMFVQQSVTVRTVEGSNEVVVRCAALRPVLAGRRPRPRWKSYMVVHQNLRWLRTSLLGRIPGWAVIPAPVGPWRPVRLRATDLPAVASRHLVATCEGAGGAVDVVVTFTGLATETFRPEDGAGVQLRVGSRTATLEHRSDGELVVATGRVVLDQVDRWWPCTHGSQPRYEVEVTVGDYRFPLGQVGFRTIEVERGDGGFGFVVNGQPVFCRGAVWFPPDPVHLRIPTEELRRRLELATRASMNMVRVPATSTYEGEEFFDLCDELGLLVWHDCMFAFLDPPAEESFEAEVTGELRSVFTSWSGHPSMALVCGSQEVEEIAAMNGRPPADTPVALTDTLVPRLVEELLPGTPYVGSNPSGGVLPFVMDHGVCQYFGVGGYLRPLEDARRAGVRFAAETLALATPPERHIVDEHCGGATRAGHDPEWKRGVHHDAGRSWDMEDVRGHYQRLLFGTDPFEERYLDPERALDLGRATNAYLMEQVFSEWRRVGSSCHGGLVLALHDLRAGAGWGVVDYFGVPKAPWYALRRVFAPVALLSTDEGLNGLALHVVNDTAVALAATVSVELFARGELPVGRGEEEVQVAPRGAAALDAGSLLGGFRDITYAYRFSPPGHDVVVASLRSPDGCLLSQTVHLPLGQGRGIEPDVGLSASARRDASGGWVLEVSTQRFAQWVSVEIEGYLPEDSWFHLPPGATRSLRLSPGGGAPSPGGEPAVPVPPALPPRGTVRALNASMAARIVEAAAP